MDLQGTKVGLSIVEAADRFRADSLKLTRKEPTVRPKPWIRVLAATLSVLVPVVASLVDLTAADAAADINSISHLLETLNGISSTVAERTDAAVQLVGDQTPPARAAVRSCLQNAGKPLAQAALAKAISQSTNPDPGNISVLAGLLGSSRALTEAGASALANFPENADALTQLKRFIDVAKNTPAVRIEAIHAVGWMIDRSAGQYLIDLLTTANQNPVIQNAAAEALVEMTGLTSYGSDVRQWQGWWATAGAKSQDQFRAMLLTSRASQFNRARQQNQQLQASATKLLGEYYYDLPDEKKSEVILKYLNDPSPEIRNIGVRLVNDNSSHPPTEPVRLKLFALISDGDENVRYEVLFALLTLNDRAALGPLIRQLGIEIVPRIKIRIMQALGKLEDPAAVPALSGLLHDEQADVKIAAANALYGTSGALGGKMRDAMPDAADRASKDLRTILEANASIPGTEAFRAACLRALAAFRDKLSFDTFNRFLQPAESNEVRRAALVGMGILGNTNADDAVANQLRDNNDRSVRLEAARALQTVATPGQAGQIFRRMSDDPDKEVKDALWIAFQNLYAKETPEDLQHWQTQFDNDPEKKLVTLKKLGDALALTPERDAVALNQQHIAETLLMIKPPRYQEAIDNLQSALEYWSRSGKGDEANLQTLVEQLMDARLLDGQYSNAVAFAAKQITAYPAYRGPLSFKIKNTADELLKANNLTGAQTLIDEALKMSPALDDRYVPQIQAIQAELKQRATSPAAH